MGVPKFFRYISERYPCLSELIDVYEIPEFDNLYLDMNGIIHVCSHPNDFDPHFRITEEKIFLDIFHYLEILFNMIKPKKLFFMAVDGVAPRAKMNQQRGRRFRSAKEAEDLEKEAMKKGETLPQQARFDSNCITPGTVFMDKLNKQLQYFITNKITKDELWQDCTVILSGHETPGEGEHKIMDYIRYLKSQPGYDPNTRHCLYGLDADLIMLGLCTHEPHFSLLREEVRYGKQEKRIVSPEETKFYLLHLSLLREYLDIEFQDLKKALTFEYNLESIIDDWVLMGFLVGNDFIPHLHDLHINKGALPILYDIYKQTLPKLGGYINENGVLNLSRFQIYMERLAEHDLDKFEDKFADLSYFKAKTGRKLYGEDGADKDVTVDVNKFKTLIDFDDFVESDQKTLELETTFKSDLNSLIAATEEELGGSNEDEEEDGDTMMQEFDQFKKHYYRSKMNFTQVTQDVLQSQAEGYIRAIQWNLFYYYHGCQSWSWYYPFHYAPFASDIKNFDNMTLEFDMGVPFLPFQQLLAVLPPASKNLLPEAYHDLMTEQTSVVIDYYPTNFETDLNGKLQEWEAVVLIPFIDETRLLDAMETCNSRLTAEEVNRNKHGPMNVFRYTERDLGYYNSPEYFPSLVTNHAAMEEVHRESVLLDKKQIKFGLLEGALSDVYFPGFPTLKHLPHQGRLEKANVKVFNYASKNESVLLKLLKQPDFTVHQAADFINEEIYVKWPHLSLAKVVSVSDSKCRYVYFKEGGEIRMMEQNKQEGDMWDSSVENQWQNYRDKLAIDIGDTELLFHAVLLEGTKFYFSSNNARVTVEKQWCKIEQPYPAQTTVRNLKIHESIRKKYVTLSDIFTVNSNVFMLGYPYYGSLGRVLECSSERVKCALRVLNNPHVNIQFLTKNCNSVQYMPSNQAAQRIGITPHLLSRLTGSVFVTLPGGNDRNNRDKRINIGLNLKFNKKEEEIPGYTKKDMSYDRWMYSTRAVDLITRYIRQFSYVVEYLARNVTNDMFHLTEMFPGEEGMKRLDEIVKWIKEEDYMKIEHVSCGAQVLDQQMVQLVENIIDSFSVESKKCVVSVKPHLLYKSDLVKGNIPPKKSADHRLLDRIISVKSSYTVPLGLRGYIIGIHNSTNTTTATQYDILFDEVFVGGMKLLGAGSARCYRSSHSTFINISDGERCAGGQNKTQTKDTRQQHQHHHHRQQQQQQQQQHPNESVFNFQNMWAGLLNQEKQPRPSDVTVANTEMVDNVKLFFSQASSTSSVVTGAAGGAGGGGGGKGPSAQLLEKFQSMNFGLPRYKFLERNDGLVVAQVNTPDGGCFTGDPVGDKRQACDSAAVRALYKYNSEPSPDKRDGQGTSGHEQTQTDNWRRDQQQQNYSRHQEQQRRTVVPGNYSQYRPVQRHNNPQQQQQQQQQQVLFNPLSNKNERMLPRPPQQWFTNNKHGQNVEVVSCNVTPAFHTQQQQQQHKQTNNTSKKEQPSPNGFVPLQAITGQRVRGAIPASKMKTRQQEYVEPCVDKQQPITTTAAASTVGTVQTASHRPRRPRIAANLPGFNNNLDY